MSDSVVLKLIEQWDAKLVADWRETAEACAPFDNAEAVARRRCLSNAQFECNRDVVCTEATCDGWRDWLEDAAALVAVAKQ